jgi:hypothetical protein
LVVLVDRQRRDAARRLVAKGIDPAVVKLIASVQERYAHARIRWCEEIFFLAR